MLRPRKTIELAFILGLATVIIVSAFYLAHFIEENESARLIVEYYGVLRMVGISIISGLNLFIPVHAATFAPMFAAAGFSKLSIIGSLVVGTLVADLLSYQLARWSKAPARAHFPRFDAWLMGLRERHHAYILPATFVFAAFIPFPNEILLIPLGLMGYHFRTFALPLILGTIVNHALYAYGFVSIFDLLF